MATLIKANGERKEIPAPSLEYAQELIGGYVERVCPRFRPDVVFLCDEEGLLKGLPQNFAGQALYGPTSPIVGDIIVMTRAEAAKAEWL